jgi:hypothetical protein
MDHLIFVPINIIADESFDFFHAHIQRYLLFCRIGRRVKGSLANAIRMAPLAPATLASPKARGTRRHKRRWRFWMAKPKP